MDMSKLKKEFPSQTENRKQWILDSIRANQDSVGFLLLYLADGTIEMAKEVLQSLQTQDRDAILLPNGILTDEQIKELGSDPEMESQEPGLISKDCS